MNESPSPVTMSRDPQSDPWTTAAATIRRVTNETPGVKSYDLKLVNPQLAAEYQFAPGQFNMLYVPGVGEAAISIADHTDGGLLRHTIRTVGAVTSELDRGSVGMTIGVRGPFGTAWPIEQLKGDPWRDGGEHKTNVILVAGGIGLAPMRSVISYLIRHRDEFEKVDLLMGARTPADLLYASQYAKWSDAEINVRTTVDRATDPWRGQVGVVTLLLDRLPIPRPRSTILLTCGPEVMMRYVVLSAEGRGIPISNIWVSLERSMNCGIGLCGHCQLGPEFMCKDGPVFRYDQIERWLRVQEL